MQSPAFCLWGLLYDIWLAEGTPSVILLWLSSLSSIVELEADVHGAALPTLLKHVTHQLELNVASPSSLRSCAVNITEGDTC